MPSEGDDRLHEIHVSFTIRVPLSQVLRIEALTELGKTDEATKALLVLNAQIREFIEAGMEGKLAEAVFKATKKARDELRYRIKLEDHTEA